MLKKPINLNPGKVCEEDKNHLRFSIPYFEKITEVVAEFFIELELSTELHFYVIMH